MLVSKLSKKMRLTSQLLKSSSPVPVHSAEYLDISSKSLVCLDQKLTLCPRVSHLALNDNVLESTEGLEHCAALWRLDCSRNKIQCLDGLSKFIALGMLDLSCNCLDWSELRKIRHLSIMDLRLHGNPKLEKDPNYRYQVISIFPNIWMLDGILISGSERKRVQAFFRESLLGKRPVRQKLSESLFIPTHMKNLTVTGVFGERTTHMMKRFPANAVHTREIDERRIQYVAYDFQQELVLLAQYLRLKGVHDVQPPPYIELLVEMRNGDQVERCNMFLLLLLVSLMFPLPHSIMEATLDVAKLLQIGPVECLPFFKLQPQLRLYIVSILFNAVIMNRECGENGGVYSQLYNSLREAVHSLVRVIPLHKTAATPVHRIMEKCLSKEALCLLSSEVVQLLCLVPAFYIHMDRELGLMELLVAATQDPAVPDKVRSIMWTERSDGADGSVIQHQIASLLLQEMKDTSSISVGQNRRYRVSSALGKKRPFSSPSHSPIGRTSSPLPRARSSSPMNHSRSRRSMPKIPALGDSVLIGKEQLGRVVALPDNKVALVQKTSGSVSLTDAHADQDNFQYMNVSRLVWDSFGYWKPVGTSVKTNPKNAWSSQSLLFSMTSLSESRQKVNESELSAPDKTVNPEEDPCPPPSSSPLPSTTQLIQHEISASPSHLTLRVDLQSASNIQPSESEAFLAAADADIPEENSAVMATSEATGSRQIEATGKPTEPDHHDNDGSGDGDNQRNTAVTVQPAAEMIRPPSPLEISASSNAASEVYSAKTTSALSARGDIELKQRLGLPVRAAGSVVWVAGESVRPLTISPSKTGFRPTKLLSRRERKSDRRTPASSHPQFGMSADALIVQATGQRLSSQARSASRPVTVATAAAASSPSSASFQYAAMRGTSAASDRSGRRRPDSATVKRRLTAALEHKQVTVYDRMDGTGTASFRIPSIRKLGAVPISTTTSSVTGRKVKYERGLT